MTGKPIVTPLINFAFNGVNFYLELRDNIIFINGASAQGKSYIREELSKYRGFPFVVNTFSSSNRLSDFEALLCNTAGHLIVIDNADILLNDKDRALISKDERNQFILLGRNPNGLRIGYPSYARVVFNRQQRLFTLKYPLLGV